MRPYVRQVAGIGSGLDLRILMNTAVVLPALLLSRGESTPEAVTVAGLLVVAGRAGDRGTTHRQAVVAPDG